MSIDLDQRLRRLADTPDPDGLLAIEDEVLARIRTGGAGHRETGIRLGAVAALGALMLGYASAMPAETSSPASLSPFAPDAPLAPSTLLAADR